MTDKIQELEDSELEALVGGTGGDPDDGDDDDNGTLIIRPDGPYTEAQTTGTGQFKIKRTNAPGG